jgi:hypothetical protein
MASCIHCSRLNIVSCRNGTNLRRFGGTCVVESDFGGSNVGNKMTLHKTVTVLCE